MHNVSYITNYTTIYNTKHIVETKVDVYDYIHPVIRRSGVSFSQIVTSGTMFVCTIPDSNIISLETHKSLFDKDEFSIGCCVSGEIDFEFYPVKDENDAVITIPQAAMLQLYIRLHDPINNIDSGWMQKGVYFIDTRDNSYSDDRIKIHGFDAMDKLNLNLIPPNVSTSTNNRSAIRSIAGTMGITNTSLLKIPSATLSQAQVDVITRGELKSFLCGIAAENCANFCVDEEGTLIAISAIPETSGTVGAIVTEENTENLSVGDEETFTVVTVIDKDGLEYTDPAPSSITVSSGFELVVEVPWGTAAIAESIRLALANFTYKPFFAENVALDPKYELGDEINVLNSSNRNRIFKQDLIFDHLMACDVEAPYDETATSEAMTASGFQNKGGIPSTMMPIMDGLPNIGVSSAFARADHVHPSDTSKADVITEVTVSDAGAVTQAVDANTIYHFTGALTSLTITFNATSGLAQYHFDFDSGSTAPTVTISGVTWQGGSFTPSANKHYEVDILNGYGVVAEW